MESRKNLSPLDKNRIKICVETFYSFSQTRLEEILLDIKLFIKNYSSVIYKTKMFLNQSFYQWIKFSRKVEDVYFDLCTLANRAIGKESLKKYTQKISKNVLVTIAKSVKRTQNGVIHIKTWLNESIKNIKDIQVPRFVTNINTQIYKSINYGLEKTSVLSQFVIKQSDLGVKKFNDVREKIITAVSKMLNTCSTFAKEKLKNAIVFQDDKENKRFIVSIKREILNFVKVEHYFSLYSTITLILNKAYENGNKIKHYIFEKYQKFLGRCCTEEKRTKIH